MHTADVIPSDTGKLLHTPFIPNRRESVIDMPIISTKPLNTDTTNDSFAISTALNYPADIILKPANKKPMKYILIPVYAKPASSTTPSLLKRLTSLLVNPATTTYMTAKKDTDVIILYVYTLDTSFLLPFPYDSLIRGCAPCETPLNIAVPI